MPYKDPIKRKQYNKSYGKKYRENNRDFLRGLSRVWSKKNRDKIRGYQKKYHVALKQRVIFHYGGKCVCCGEKNIGFLTLDHLNRDGAKHRQEISHKKRKGVGVHTYSWLVSHNFPKKYKLQVLCYNCNCGREHNGGVCPHIKKL